LCRHGKNFLGFFGVFRPPQKRCELKVFTDWEEEKSNNKNNIRIHTIQKSKANTRLGVVSTLAIIRDAHKLL
jgi:hypothetical protein